MKKLNKVLSVLLTLAIVASMFVVAAPVSANVGAAPTVYTDQVWVKADTPATDTYVVSESGSQIGDVIKLVYNYDKSAIYAIAKYDTINDDPNNKGNCYAIFKTEDEARSWELVATNTYIVDIVASNIDPEVMVYAGKDKDDFYDVYITRDGGENWVKQINAYEALTKIEKTETFTSIDYIVNSGKEYVYVGTEKGNVIDLELTNGNGTWFDTQAGLLRVFEVKAIASDYTSKMGVMTLGVESASGAQKLVLYKRYNQEAWKQNKADVVIETASNLSALKNATLWLSDDYDVAATTSIIYIGKEGTVESQSGLFYGNEAGFKKVDFGATIGKEFQVNNIAGYGNADNPTLVVAGKETASGIASVIRSNTIYNWYEALTQPQGGNAYVLLLDGYKDNGKALAGTTAVSSNKASGVYISSDSCKNFLKISLMANEFEGVYDVAGDLYLLAKDGDELTIWRNINGYWELVSDETGVTGTPTIKVAADGSLWKAVETDSKMVFSVSTNSAITFNPVYKYEGYYSETTTVVAWLPLSENSYVVALADGAIFAYDGLKPIVFNRPTDTKNYIGKVTDFVINDGTVYAYAYNAPTLIEREETQTVVTTTIISTSDKGNTWEAYKESTATVLELGLVESGKTVYATGDKVPVFKLAYTDDVLVSTASAIVAAADCAGNALEGTGVKYELIESETDLGKVIRTLGKSKIQQELVYGGSTTESASGIKWVLGKLWLTKDGDANVINALASDGIYSYKDTICKPGTGLTLTQGNSAKSLGKYDITVSFNPMDNVEKYTIFYTTNPYVVSSITNIDQAYQLVDLDLVNRYKTGYHEGTYESASKFDETRTAWFVEAATTKVIATVGTDKTFYVSVFATTAGSTNTELHALNSFAYNTADGESYAKVSTPLSAPKILTPYMGETYVEYTAAQITWSAGSKTDYRDEDWYGIYKASTDCTGYELQIVKYAPGEDYATSLEDAPFIEVAKGVLAYSPKLEADSSYAVRVRAISATSKGKWSEIVTFSTVEDTSKVVVPTTPAPVVTTVVVKESQYTLTQAPAEVTTVVLTNTVTNTPAPVIDMPEASTPAYIYIIIAIGAILCIAVIVLIVRTRRVA